MVQDQLRILLIEHDPGFSRSLGEMLGKARELPAQMRTAPDLSGGLHALRRDNFDLVVLDVCVPDGAGLASVQLLHAEAPTLPIIVAGEADSEVVALEAVHAGAQDYLVKGQLTPSWLERSVRYAIERHRIDLAHIAAEQKYHSVFDHLVEGIFQTTPDGRYLIANAALARIYGYASPEELMQSLVDIGRRLYVRDDRRDEFIRLMHENDVLTGFESQVYRKDGSVIWISENCRAVRDTRGLLLYYEGTVEDITQRRLAEEKLQAKNLEIEDDLRMAREIQIALLPQHYPAFPAADGRLDSVFQFTHRYLPAATVGGDFFTISALSDNEVGILICDVAGHGVRAALVTTMIRALVEELKPLASHPGRFLTKMNLDLHALLRHIGTPILTTAFYLVADSRQGGLRYANAGHPKPLHLRRGEGEVAPLAGFSGRTQPALGLFENTVYHSSDGTLSRGDLLLLFTDGLIDVPGPTNELYTTASLVGAVRRRLQLPTAQLVDEVMAEVQGFSATGAFVDDVCVVGLEFAKNG